MIRINKSGTIPSILIDKGESKKVEYCQLYSTDSTDYDNGTAKFNILSNVYGDLSVKKQLIDDQNEKCCFCEADFTANSYGDVEHFRPKAAFARTQNGELIRPGYYWLVYDWNNLFFSCQICNQRFKKNYFPLEDESKRAKNHTFDYHAEAPLLLHPSVDNPEDHITFNRYIPVAKSARGEASIKGYGLDSVKLNRVRERHYQRIQLSMSYKEIDLAKITSEDKQELSHQFKLPWMVLEEVIITAQKIISEAGLDTQPFSAMVRANFPDLV